MKLLRNALLGLTTLPACSYAPGEAPDAAPVAPSPDAAPTVASPALVIDALGVQGFVVRHGGDALMTAPLFTRQNAVEVTLNVPLAPDEPASMRGSRT